MKFDNLRKEYLSRIEAGRRYCAGDSKFVNKEETVNLLNSILKKKALTLSIAESCTGGLLSKMLTDKSGSSAYFCLGLVTYSNSAKAKILKIDKGLLRTKGAVSKEVALEMAKSVRQLAKTELGLSISGIAGPSGATKTKPLGLVYIALSTKKKSEVFQSFPFFSGRDATHRE